MRPSSAIFRTSRTSRQVLFQRHQSSSTLNAADSAKQVATKAQQQASVAAAKAQEGLKTLGQKVGPALTGILGSLGKLGGRTGRLVAKVEDLIPPTIYYSKVASELSKLVWSTRKMAPPPLSAFRQYYEGLYTKALKGEYKLPSIEKIKTKAQDRDTLIGAGIIGAELLGFFTVGEIIGRRKIIGYRGKVDHGHH